MAGFSRRRSVALTPGTGPISAVPPSPPRGPAHFLPASPSDLRLPDNEGQCGAAGTETIAVNWGLGATRGPNAAMTLYDNGTTPVALTAADASRLVFVSYFGVCFHFGEGLAGIRVQRLSIAAYDPATNTFRARWNVFDTNSPTPTGDTLPWQQAMSSPVFDGGHLYLYAGTCDELSAAYAACLAGPVVVARAPLSSLHQASSYQYWRDLNPADPDDPANWSTDGTLAASIVATTGGGPIGVHVGDFSATGDGYLLMEQTSMGLHHKLWQSDSPVGPWTLVRTDQVPGCTTGAGAGCYALTGHPELSTAGELLYSFYDNGPQYAASEPERDGEVEVVGIPGAP
ncbi:MAG TPA: hypothetical protein VFI47_09700 [Acidimicrobiales bacterium]|nr:hypothetical protein [Acidimicrobiales bacterium]